MHDLTTLRDRVRAAEGLHDKIARDAGIERPTVYCRTCGASQKVDGAHCLRHGWPKCCGFTMTLDRPAALEGRDDG